MALSLESIGVGCIFSILSSLSPVDEKIDGLQFTLDDYLNAKAYCEDVLETQFNDLNEKDLLIDLSSNCESSEVCTVDH